MSSSATIRRVIGVKCTDVKKQPSTSINSKETEKKKIYTLTVFWSDSATTEIEKTSLSFADLRTQLIKDYYNDRRDITVPDISAPAKKRLDLLGSFVCKKEKNKRSMEEFCQQVIKLPDVRGKLELLTGFFTRQTVTMATTCSKSNDRTRDSVPSVSGEYASIGDMEENDTDPVYAIPCLEQSIKKTEAKNNKRSEVESMPVVYAEVNKPKLANKSGKKESCAMPTDLISRDSQLTSAARQLPLAATQLTLADNQLIIVYNPLYAEISSEPLHSLPASQIRPVIDNQNKNMNKENWLNDVRSSSVASHVKTPAAVVTSNQVGVMTSQSHERFYAEIDELARDRTEDIVCNGVSPVEIVEYAENSVMEYADSSHLDNFITSIHGHSKNNSNTKNTTVRFTPVVVVTDNDKHNILSNQSSWTELERQNSKPIASVDPIHPRKSDVVYGIQKMADDQLELLSHLQIAAVTEENKDGKLKQCTETRNESTITSGVVDGYEPDLRSTMASRVVHCYENVTSADLKLLQDANKALDLSLRNGEFNEVKDRVVSGSSIYRVLYSHIPNMIHCQGLAVTAGDLVQVEHESGGLVFCTLPLFHSALDPNTMNTENNESQSLNERNGCLLPQRAGWLPTYILTPYCQVDVIDLLDDSRFNHLPSADTSADKQTVNYNKGRPRPAVRANTQLINSTNSQLTTSTNSRLITAVNSQLTTAVTSNDDDDEDDDDDDEFILQHFAATRGGQATCPYPPPSSPSKLVAKRTVPQPLELDGHDGRNADQFAIPSAPNYSAPKLNNKSDATKLTFSSNSGSIQSSMKSFNHLSSSTVTLDDELSVMAISSHSCSGDENVLVCEPGTVGSLIYTTDTGWWCVRTGGHVFGWVPADCWRIVSTNGAVMKEESWLVGAVPRTTCEEWLMSYGQDREFLVRKSTTLVSNYAISVRHADRVHHVPIVLTADQKYDIGKHHFRTIYNIIIYYKKNDLFTDKYGNGVTLGSPISLPTDSATPNDLSFGGYDHFAVA